MKLSPIRQRQSNSGKHGVALLLVLVCLAILTVMVLSLFLNVNSELRTSKVYANGAMVKLLSQSAVDLVKGEIYQATSDSTLCWASQPGMIRTYDNTGAALQYYKLYSDYSMIGPLTGTGSTVFNHTNPSLVPDGNNGTTAWYSQRGVYVDLNQPISVNGVNQYPILDGQSGVNDLVSFTYPTALPTLVTQTPTPTTTVNVLGPRIASGPLQGSPQVQGFWLNSNTPVDPSSPNQAPMPVRWLYILRDGKMAVPDASTGGIITFTGTAVNGVTTGNTVFPSASDPIVGRIAFWTDDETSKININTASEGSYNNTSTYATSFNDTPRVCTQYDLNLAKAPSWQNEFQRYPGHPATVSLSTVFGNLTTSTTYPENIYSGIAPRTIAGGSTEATQTYSTTASTLNLLSNPLYATTDELLLKPWSPRTENSIDPTTASSPAALQRAQFFITASSRAPDVNLFNLPRISMWPISGNTPATTYQTPYDQVIAFCTTIGGDPYYFQRSDYTSPNELISSTPSSDPAYVQRNYKLYSYLKTLCSTAIPGFTSTTFASKYATANTSHGTELDQILMEAFDYIRCVNISDISLAAADRFNPLVSKTGSGEVVPTYNSSNDTKGFGRMETISKAGILFIAAGDSTTKQVIQATGGTVTINGPAVAAGKVRVQAALVFQMFDPSQGYTAIYPGATIKVTSSTLTWNSPNGTTMFNIPAGGVSLVAASASNGQGWGGNLGMRAWSKAYVFSGTLTNPTLQTAVPTTATQAAPYPDFSTAGTPITFSGAVTAQVVSASGTVVQTLNFNFPSTSVAAPSVVAPETITSRGALPPLTIHFTNFRDPDTSTNGSTIQDTGRFDVDNNAAGGGPAVWKLYVTSHDILQSVQSVSGDLRLIAAHNTVDAVGTSLLFGKHPNYGTSNLAHSFLDSDGTVQYGATRGQLAPSATSYYGNPSPTTYPLSTSFTWHFNDPVQNPLTPNSPAATCEPEGFGSGTIAAGVTAGTTATWTSTVPLGDFDNGTGMVRDGPYINKPDEGELNNSTFVPYFMQSGEAYVSFTPAYFSPARQMPSPVMLGSLPTGVIDNRPWQTLLFHPDPTGKHVGNAGLSGANATLTGAPPDHLLLDLFTMPVVEPYAISEPLSTEGRINMNYLIVPFTYINRDTAIRAVLESQQMLTVPNTNPVALLYKQSWTGSAAAPNFTGFATNYRWGINLDETMKGFINRFYPKAINSSSTVAPDIFRSPTEICTLPLVPADTSYTPTASYSTIATYWQNHQLTGDNSLERPYANIYPLLTTKSNTFTVHFRVQTLQPAQDAGANPTVWREPPATGAPVGTDVITGEYRGSQTIERYVDPADTRIPDYASNPTATPALSSLYKFRVVSTKQFSP